MKSIASIGTVRRMVFFLACLSLLLPVAAGASGNVEKKDRLVVLSHKVHQTSANGTQPEADVTRDFIARNGLQDIEWRTFGTEEIKEKLFREASLPDSSVDVGFITNFWSSPVITNLFVPLDDYLKKAPIEDFQDIPASTQSIFKFGGKQYGIPVRVASLMVHANVAYFKERGVPFPPKTLEELYAAARKLTFTKPDGEKVFGLVLFGTPQVIGESLIGFARAWPNADYVSPDYQVRCNERPVVTVVEKVKGLLDEGVLPPDILSLSINDGIALFQNGRAAMFYGASAYYGPFNDPKVSKVAGNARVFAVPPSVDSPAGMEIADGVVNVWAMVIPRGAASKDLSWDFIRHLSGKAQSLQMALNGNGPTRQSLYDDPQYSQAVSPAVAEVIKRIIRVGRGAWPGFDNVTQAQELVGREIHLALLGKKTAQQAMDDAAVELKKLVPKQ